MDARTGFLAALREGTVAERRITRRVFADWLEEHGEDTEANRQRLLGEEPFCNALGMEFVHLPPGTFWMGGREGVCGENQVHIESDFYLGVYPVTQNEWTTVMASNPSYFRKDGEGADLLIHLPEMEIRQFPVETVSWEDCQEFVKRLNETCPDAGWIYALPTEVQWEYACRGAATTPEDCAWDFYFLSPTNDLTPEAANFAKSAFERPTVVGSYAPNPLGIFDLHGNVFEWCQDLAASTGPHRVLRGGAWYYSAAYCRAAFREYDSPSNRINDAGFRLARVRVGWRNAAEDPGPFRPVGGILGTRVAL
jgi:formylglycine-generating enzyme required for sulfatase activity